VGHLHVAATVSDRESDENVVARHIGAARVAVVSGLLMLSSFGCGRITSTAATAERVPTPVEVKAVATSDRASKWSVVGIVEARDGGSLSFPANEVVEEVAVERGD
jgi:hypothetical protein